jgi:hypothetical protein
MASGWVTITTTAACDRGGAASRRNALVMTINSEGMCGTVQVGGCYPPSYRNSSHHRGNFSPVPRCPNQ